MSAANNNNKKGGVKGNKKFVKLDISISGGGAAVAASGGARGNGHHGNGHRGNGARGSGPRGGHGHGHKREKREDFESLTLTEFFAKKFYDLCYSAGIKSNNVRQSLIRNFFGDQYAKEEEVEKKIEEESKSSEDDEDDVLQRMAAAAQKQTVQGRVEEEVVNPVDEKREVTAYDVTTAGMVIIKMFNNFLNKDDNLSKIPEEGAECVKVHTEKLSKLPPYFSFPTYAKIPAKFIENMTMLDVLPQFINLTFDEFDELYFTHVRALNYFDVYLNQDGVVGSVPPSECEIALNKNRIVSFDSKKKDRYKVMFLTATSDVSIGKFPKEIKFLPKSIGRFLRKLPTIGQCFYAVQDSTNTKSLESWIATKEGAEITGGQITPSPEYLASTLELACGVLDAIHSTSANRNSHSQNNIHLENKKKFIFPIIFSKFHSQIGHTFGSDFTTVKDVASGLKDFRYLSASIEIAMISSLLLIADKTKYIDWIQTGLGDYFRNIGFRQDESPESKRDRIFNIANPALLSVITCLHEISQFDACKSILTEDESRLIHTWLSSAFDLFPRNNRPNTSHNNHHNNDDSLESAEVTSAKKSSGNWDKTLFSQEDFPPAMTISIGKAAGNSKNNTQTQKSSASSKPIGETHQVDIEA